MKHSEATKTKIGLKSKGRISSMKGKTMPERAKALISAARKGKPITAIQGDRHYAWKGGRTKLQKIIRHSVCYRSWREMVFKRDDYTCVECKAKNGNGKRVVLNADHYPKAFCELLTEHNIKSYADAIACNQLWELGIARTLCLSCHRKTFKFWRNQWN